MKLLCRFWVVLAVGLIGVQLMAVDMKWGRKLQPGSDPNLSSLYRQMTEQTPCVLSDTPGFSITRPGFSAVLADGKTWLEQGDGGIVNGLYYEGSGTLSFEVADPIERANLKKYIGSEAVQSFPFQSLYILPLGTCKDIPRPPQASGAVNMVFPAGDYTALKNGFHAGGMSWLSSLLNRGLQADPDIVVVFRMKGDLWAYVLNSLDMEEVSLRRLGNPPHTDAWWWDRVVSLHREPSGLLKPSLTDEEGRAKIFLDAIRFDVNMSLDVEGNLGEGSFTEAKLSSARPVRAVYFNCSPLLNVQSVTLNGKEAVPFIKEEFSLRAFHMDYGFVVLLPKETQGEFELTLRYGGDLFDKEPGFKILRDDTVWFPVIYDWDGYQFGLRATVPKGYEVMTVGDLVEHKEGLADGREFWAYDMKSNIYNSSMVMGKLKHTHKTFEGIDVDIAVPDNVRTILINQNVKEVMKEVGASIETYTKLFGKLPIKSLKVGLHSWGLNLSFSGLILLSEDVFTRTGSSWPEQAVAHEVAHQWWLGGHSAALTYRDVWLPEALAEFASYLYMKENHGPDEMNKYLSHDYNTMNKLSAIHKVPYVDEGPICMGSRLSTTLDPDSGYDTVIYYKAAWVLLDLSRMTAFTKAGEKGFFDGLKEFADYAKDRRVTVADLQRCIEHGTGVSLGWFFKQWLECVGIPKVKVKTTVDGSGASMKLVVESTQATTLTLPIPIQAFQGERVHEYLFFAKPGSSRQEYPLPFKPSKVTVDAGHACLADYGN